MILPLHLTLSSDELHQYGIKLFIYRGDLEHEQAPGNKWHKLKYNLEQAKQQGAKHIVSFGGPYSNHLHALANVCNSLNLTPVAIVRGELHPKLTPTLKDFSQQRGILWPSSRQDYRLGMASPLVEQISAYYANTYWVPEGGSNQLGVRGCYDWAEHILQKAQQQHLHFDAWALSAGTGATSAGFLAHHATPDLLVFPALKGGKKGGKNLLNDIQAFALHENSQTNTDKLTMYCDYHCGGYAKFPPDLQNYVQSIHAFNPQLTLDPIYTAKVVYGLEQEIVKGNLYNKCILLIHTGGLQGWRGFSG